MPQPCPSNSNRGCNGVAPAACCSPTAFPTVAHRCYTHLLHRPTASLRLKRSPRPPPWGMCRERAHRGVLIVGQCFMKPKKDPRSGGGGACGVSPSLQAHVGWL